MRQNMTRAGRLAALGKNLIAARWKSGSPTQKKNRIVDQLLRLHGLPQKIGQMLSLTELESDSPAFTKLVETEPQLSLHQAMAEIEGALGRPWNDCFLSVDSRGIGTSLAQVHRATLPDGREVAIKIQYPEIAKALGLDLKALGWLMAPIGGLRKGLDLPAIRCEIGAMLKRELDYRHEAEMLRQFALHAVPGVEIPQVVSDLSNERILVMTWVAGQPFRDILSWPLEDRRAVAAIFIKAFLTSVFRAKIFHADPHPGNYRFRRGKEGVTVGVLDFGCVKELPAKTVKALHGLIADTISGHLRNDADRALARFEDIGFRTLLLDPMRHLLPELCDILFAPFLQDCTFDMKAWHLGERVENKLGELRWNFRMAGPPSLIYFMRAYQGLIQYLSALDVAVNWRSIYERSTDGQPSKLTHPKQPGTTQPPRSHALRIRAGRTKAELSLPAIAAENLSDLIPPEVEPHLVARHINVAEITRSFAEEGFPPGELFSLQDRQDEIRVWLE